MEGGGHLVDSPELWVSYLVRLVILNRSVQYDAGESTWMQHNAPVSSFRSYRNMARLKTLTGDEALANVIGRRTKYFEHSLGVRQKRPRAQGPCSRNDPHLPQPGQLAPEAYMCVDRVSETGAADLDRAQNRLFTEVERPVHKCPVCEIGR